MCVLDATTASDFILNVPSQEQFSDVRLWHKLTWNDIRNLQVKPRDLKWGQHGK